MSTGNDSCDHDNDNYNCVRMRRRRRRRRTNTGQTDKKLTNTLVIRTFLSFELADIFLSMGVVYFSKKLKKTPISILIANDNANTTP